MEVIILSFTVFVFLVSQYFTIFLYVFLILQAMQNLAITSTVVTSSKPPPAPSKAPAKPVVQTDLKSAVRFIS